MSEEENNAKNAVNKALVSLQDRLYALICTLTGNSAEAEDILQETSQAIFLSAEKYDPVRPVWPWFKQFAVNQVRVWRTHQQRAFVSFDSDLVDRIADTYPDEQTVKTAGQEYADFLEPCLQKLKPWHRDLLTERYAKRTTVKTLSERLHLSYDSLAVLLFQLRKTLKKCIEKSASGVEDGDGPEKLPQSPFNRLLEKILDMTASPQDRQEFSGWLASDDEKLKEYVEQMRMNALLQCHSNHLLEKGTSAKPVFRVKARTALIAAAALAAVLTGGMWLTRQGKPRRLPPIAADSHQMPSNAGKGAPPAALKPAPQIAVALPPLAPKMAATPAPVVATNRSIAVAKLQNKKEKEKTMNIASIKPGNITTAAVAAAALLSSAQKAALAASESSVPVVSNVTFRQPFGTRMLEIGYTLSNGPGIVTVDITTNGVSIGDANVTYLSGEVNKVVQNGAYTITWDTKYAWPNHTNEQARAVVTAWATNCPPDYMVVDLSAYTNILYYTSAAALPDGGLSNNVYREARLVMRKIVAAGVSFTMGSATDRIAVHPATLTKDYYLGIYPVTQYQWALIKSNDRPSRWAYAGDWAERPVESVSYYDVRESTDNKENSAYWYPNDPNPASFLGLLRAKTGIAFDLPSEAEWEYACRAGNADSKWGNGADYTSATEDTGLTGFGRYKYNGGWLNDGKTRPTVAQANILGDSNGTARVGSYLPNSWGLYDMSGNVWEWCLDWYAADITSLNGTVNTTKLSNTTDRVDKGGCAANDAQSSRPAFRDNCLPSYRNSNSAGYELGVRVRAPAVGM